MVMTATATKRRPQFAVKALDTTFEVDGTKLKRALALADVKQSYLAKACGHSDATRVCHIIRKGKQRIGGKTLEPMVKALEKLGVDVIGFYEE